MPGGPDPAPKLRLAVQELNVFTINIDQLVSALSEFDLELLRK